MSAPTIPARPERSQNHNQAPGASLEPPQIPSRPARFSPRAASRERAEFSRSPLNELPAGKSIGGFYQQSSTSTSSLHGNRSPNVASMPLIGQEGSEYASLHDMVDQLGPIQDLPHPPTTTRNISEDLPLHAPTASVHALAAKSRIATVTRTDSIQAAQAGIGRPQSEIDEQDLKLHHTTSKGHRRSASQMSGQGEHRSSSAIPDEEHEHGIPMIGAQVPMYPNAGDVQAPSPSPFQSSHSTGVGFFNDSSSPRPPTTEGRRRSTQFPAPPGSYGLHGHGVIAGDQFEKAWYQKHPQEASKEYGAYGPAIHTDRAQYSMSSEDLNNLVRSTSRTGSGMGKHNDGRP